MSTRYALYWAPAAGSPLAQLGEHWLGREAATGRMLKQPALDGFSSDEVARITVEPRRYGLHATLKPPFRLAAGYTAADLELRLASFAAMQSPLPATPLRAVRLERFLALTPETPPARINALAATCVEAFDCFRAAPDAEELGRRRPAGLSARQEENLRRWGYPFVMEEFRFHVTLSSPLDDATAKRLLPLLSAHFSPATTASIEINEVALFIEPMSGAPFRLVRRFSFGG